MGDEAASPATGAPAQVRGVLHGAGGRRIGTVDAVFVDYLLVRTAGILPVDLYIPRPEVGDADGRLTVDATPDEAFERWHRPLKRAPHG
jgi:hypothetical protein